MHDKEKRLFSVKELSKFMRRYRYRSGNRMRSDVRKLLAHNQMDALIWLTGSIKEFTEDGQEAFRKRLDELQELIDGTRLMVSNFAGVFHFKGEPRLLHKNIGCLLEYTEFVRNEEDL